MKKSLLVLIVLIVTIMCGGCNVGNDTKNEDSDNVSSKVSEDILIEIMPDEILKYTYYGYECISELKSLELEKGLEEEDKYTAYCKVVLEDDLMQRTAYYIFQCVKYDITGWEVVNYNEYEEEEIIVFKGPAEQLLSTNTTISEDKTIYGNGNSFQYSISSVEKTDYYTLYSSGDCNGYLYRSMGENGKEYIWEIDINNNYDEAEIVFNEENLLGKFEYVGSLRKGYFQINSVENNVITYKCSYEKTYETPEYGSGEATVVVDSYGWVYIYGFTEEYQVRLSLTSLKIDVYGSSGTWVWGFPEESVTYYPVDNDYQETEIVINVHYHRPDNEYDMWSVWLWPSGGDGEDYQFGTTVDEYGVVATAMFPKGTEYVGFIIRTPIWEKDIDGDRFIDLSNIDAGTVDVYVESGIEYFSVSQ